MGYCSKCVYYDTDEYEMPCAGCLDGKNYAERPMIPKTNELKQRVINALENLDYYDVVNECQESLEAELIADAVFEVICDYLKGR